MRRFERFPEKWKCLCIIKLNQPFFLLNDKQICLREGHEGMKLLGPYKGYNMETDATASNEVGAAAFR